MMIDHDHNYKDEYGSPFQTAVIKELSNISDILDAILKEIRSRPRPTYEREGIREW